MDGNRRDSSNCRCVCHHHRHCEGFTGAEATLASFVAAQSSMPRSPRLRYLAAHLSCLRHHQSRLRSQCKTGERRIGDGAKGRGGSEIGRGEKESVRMRLTGMRPTGKKTSVGMMRPYFYQKGRGCPEQRGVSNRGVRILPCHLLRVLARHHGYNATLHTRG